jgi:hypothetical protein
MPKKQQPKQAISDNIQSEEAHFDPRFVKRWADRCIEMKDKFGQAIANDFFQKFFTPVTKRLINQELNRRKSEISKKK